MSRTPRFSRARLSAWIQRWKPLLPIFMAEFIVMLGFGALLPVLPVFVQEQGVDSAMLGVIIAGWPIGKLVAEPIGGWWADRHARKPQMVLGLAVLGISSMLMLVFTSVLLLFLMRFISGAAAGAYDAAARGTLVDGTDEDERGEVFGLYGAFQMGGFVLGPAIGAFGAAIVGGFAFPFVLVGALSVVAAVVLAAFLDRNPHAVEDPSFEHDPEAEPAVGDVNFGATTTPRPPTDAPEPVSQAPFRALWNRTLITAILIGFGMQLTFGTYEVVWSIYLLELDATLEWVGLTYMVFAIPSMIVSPIAGRHVDRRGPMKFIIVACLVVMVSGVFYAIAVEPVLPTVVVFAEATATAVLATALFALVAMGTPQGRSSTAQGIYGAAGTIGLITASVLAGVLYGQHYSWPFWFFVGGLAVFFVLGMLVYYGGRWRQSSRPLATPASP